MKYTVKQALVVVVLYAVLGSPLIACRQRPQSNVISYLLPSLGRDDAARTRSTENARYVLGFR